MQHRGNAHEPQNGHGSSFFGSGVSLLRIAKALGAVALVIASVGITWREAGEHQPCSKIALPLYAAMTSDALVRQADVIVIGQVVEATPHYVRSEGSCDDIYTTVRFRVEQQLGGNEQGRPGMIRFRYFGGKIGDDESVTEGLLPFTVGQRDLLFLSRADSFLKRGGVYPLRVQGRYVIAEDGTLGTDDLQRMFLRDIWGNERPTLEELIERASRLRSEMGKGQ